jgi:hypothetical protein
MVLVHSWHAVLVLVLLLDAEAASVCKRSMSTIAAWVMKAWTPLLLSLVNCHGATTADASSSEKNKKATLQLLNLNANELSTACHSSLGRLLRETQLSVLSLNHNTSLFADNPDATTSSKSAAEEEPSLLPVLWDAVSTSPTLSALHLQWAGMLMSTMHNMLAALQQSTSMRHVRATWCQYFADDSADQPHWHVDQLRFMNRLKRERDLSILMETYKDDDDVGGGGNGSGSDTFTGSPRDVSTMKNRGDAIAPLSSWSSHVEGFFIEQEQAKSRSILLRNHLLAIVRHQATMLQAKTALLPGLWPLARFACHEEGADAIHCALTNQMATLGG